MLTITYSGKDINIVKDNAGYKLEKTITLAPDQQLEGDPEEQVLAGGAKPGKQIELYDLDENTMTLSKEIVVYRGPVKTLFQGRTVPALRVDIISRRGMRSTYLSPDHNFLKSTTPYGYEQFAASKAEATKRPKVVVALVDQNELVPNKKLQNARGLAQLTIGFVGPMPPESGVPSDEHQTVTKSATGWQINVHPVALDQFNAQTIAESVNGQEQWLKPDTNIPAEDPEFKALAAKIVGDETRVFWAIQSIKNWVGQNMRVNDNIDLVRHASEVLKSKEGVCRDYAILTVTLLRAAGIPAMLASGLVSWDGTFAYHQWVLAWDGKHWLGVDSMIPDEQLSASHVELSTGDFTEAYSYIAVFQPMKILSARAFDPALAKAYKPAAPSKEEVGEEKASPNVKPLLDRAEALLKEGATEAAEKALIDAVGLETKSFEPADKLAQFYSEHGRVEEAVAVYRAAAVKWPHNPYLLQFIGFHLVGQGKYSEAERYYWEARKHDTDQSEYPELLTRVYYPQGKYLDAEVQARQWAHQQPKVGLAHATLGVTLQMQGRYAEATDSYMRAIKVDPKSLYAYSYLGACLHQQRRYKEAVVLSRKALAVMARQKPRQPIMEAAQHLNLALSLIELKQRSAATKEARLAMRLGIKGHPIYKRLGIKDA